MEFVNACDKGDIEYAGTLAVQRLFQTQAFERACFRNDMVIAKWLLNTYPSIDVSYAIEYVCNLDMLKWLLSCMQLDLNVDSAFEQACSDGNIDIAQWLWHNMTVRETGDSLILACEQGHQHVVQWLISLETCIIDADDLFARACISGNMDLVRWFMKTYDIGQHTMDTSCFRDACSSNKTHVVQWMLAMFHDADLYNVALTWACFNGDLNQVMWLVNRNVYDNFHEIMYDTCRNGHLHIIKWFTENYPMINLDVDTLYDCACESGNVDLLEWVIDTFLAQDCKPHQRTLDKLMYNSFQMIRWIHALYPNVLDKQKDRAFVRACEEGNLELAQWLLQMYPDIDVYYRDCLAIVQTIICNKIHVARWLKHTYPNMNLVNTRLLVVHDCERVDFLLESTCNDVSYYYLHDMTLHIVSPDIIAHSVQAVRYHDHYIYSMIECDVTPVITHIKERFRRSRIKSARKI